MRIIATSDTHGYLPDIGKCDVFVIAGDWSPLSCQLDYKLMMVWVEKTMLPYLKKIECEDILIISGNHDFCCLHKNFKNDFQNLLNTLSLENKVHLINHTTFVKNDITFYGIPNVEDLVGWAFYSDNIYDYRIPSEADILISHQPPKIGSLGIPLDNSCPDDFGSLVLRNNIRNSNLKLCICGHIHSGSHTTHIFNSVTNSSILLYNVSYLDEDYNVKYKPSIIDF